MWTSESGLSLRTEATHRLQESLRSDLKQWSGVWTANMFFWNVGISSEYRLKTIGKDTNFNPNFRGNIACNRQPFEGCYRIPSLSIVQPNTVQYGKCSQEPSHYTQACRVFEHSLHWEEIFFPIIFLQKGTHLRIIESAMDGSFRYTLPFLLSMCLSARHIHMEMWACTYTVENVWQEICAQHGNYFISEKMMLLVCGVHTVQSVTSCLVGAFPIL